MTKSIVTRNSQDDNAQQMSLFDQPRADGRTLPELIADGGTDWPAFDLDVQIHDGKKVFLIQDWLIGIAQTDNPRRFWTDLKKRLTKAGDQLYASCVQLPHIATDGKKYQMDYATAKVLYQITQRMDAETGIRTRVLNYLAGAGVLIDVQRMSIEESQGLHRAQDVTAYQLKGKTSRWAEARVDGKSSHQMLSHSLQQTHVVHEPDYGRIFGAQSEALFDKAKYVLVEEMALTRSQASHFRDYLSNFALQALNAASLTAVERMKSEGRPLTDEEQVEIVCTAAKIMAPAFKAAAQYAGRDFVSGDPLDANGRRIRQRQQKLLKDGK